MRKKSSEDSKLKRKYHKASPKHVLVLETDLSYQNKCKIFHCAELERKAGNDLIAIMKNNYEQLIRTKKYKNLKSLYGKAKDLLDKCLDDKKVLEYKQKVEDLSFQMQEMQKKYNVTWDFCRTKMISIAKKYNLSSVIALTKAEDVWKAVETCLYRNGETLHFAKREDLPVIRAKQIDKVIIFSIEDNKLSFKFQKRKFGVKIKDRFEQDEVNAIIKYLKNSDSIDNEALRAYQEKIFLNTYRPCYACLVCQKIRGKCRVFVHITLDGKAMPKFDKNGNPKHKFGTGVIGCDIGTQTIAYTSDSEVGLKNLAERGSSILKNERKEKALSRAMERSRRASNPDYYNKDGTIKKGKKRWKKSKRYIKLRQKHRDFCRINAINRHLAINEEVNHLRSLGDTFVTEPKNAKKLQKRAKKTTVNKKGKINRKKRFGKSIQNRCPGYFQAQIERKFNNSGGKYIEVPNDYRASQYDHISNQYIKKKLSQRMYKLRDGTLVQRDWYSSFLLYCIEDTTTNIDIQKCKMKFQELYKKEKALIQWIKYKNIKVLNSGIKTI